MIAFLRRWINQSGTADKQNPDNVPLKASLNSCGSQSLEHDAIILDVPPLLAAYNEDVLAACRAATDEVLELIKPGGYDNLARHSPGLASYQWETYLRLSMLRLVRVGTALKQHAPLGGKVLDFGSYFGNASLMARSLGFEVTALDTYDSYAPALERERAKLESSGIRVVDTSNSRDALDKTGEVFDAIILLGVIEHIPHTPKQLLEYVCAHLAPGGLLLLDTPNLAYLYRREQLMRGESVFLDLKLQFHTELPFEGHHREFTHDEVICMLEQVNLSILDIEMFIYLLYHLPSLAGADARRYKEMEEDPLKREVIFVAARKDVLPGSIIQALNGSAISVHNVAISARAQADASIALIQTLKAVLRSMLAGQEQNFQRIEAPLPFSRAKSSDYAEIVALFKADAGRNIASLAPRPCPACATSNHRHLFDSYDGYPFHVCDHCGAWFVPLRVTDGFIDGFFQRVPEARRIADRMMAGREAGTRETDRIRFGHYFEMAETALSGADEPIRYLDIGCGVGHSIELAAERGFDATGVEINAVALDVAKASRRNVLHPKDFDAKTTFHLVSMFETLEHVTAPDEVIALAARQLAPGGMVMITVPNRACWELSVKRQASLHIFGGTEGVGHINLFDARSLRCLLERHGLRLVHTDGQFSSNLLDVFDAILQTDRDGAPKVDNAQLSFTIPSVVHGIINSIGPYVADLDRLTDRSPILIAVACREQDADTFAEVVTRLERQRRAEIQTRLV